MQFIISEHVGYIKNRTNCISADAAARVVGVADASTNNDDCGVFYISGTAVNGFAIQLLDGLHRLKFDCLCDGKSITVIVHRRYSRCLRNDP